MDADGSGAIGSGELGNAFKVQHAFVAEYTPIHCEFSQIIANGSVLCAASRHQDIKEGNQGDAIRCRG